MSKIIEFRKPDLKIVSEKTRECSICGEPFKWTKQSSWYGSEYQVEECPEEIIIMCTKKCEDKHFKENND